MISVKIRELKKRLSALLRALERGTVTEVIVTNRDRPVARIVPIASSRPGVTIIPAKVPFASVRGKRRRPAGWGISSLDLLREERGDR